MHLIKDTLHLLEAYQEVSPGVIKWIEMEPVPLESPIIICTCELSDRNVGRHRQPQGITTFKNIVTTKEVTIKSALNHAVDKIQTFDCFIEENIAIVWTINKPIYTYIEDIDDTVLEGNFIVAISSRHPAYKLVAPIANIGFSGVLDKDRADDWDELVTDQ